MRIRAIPLVVGLYFASGLQTAQACVCSEPVVSDREEASAEFQAAAVVFEGELLPGGHYISSWNGKPSLSMIPFRVTRSYKGASGEVLEVYDAHAGTDCGFGAPIPGTRFFVYGFRGEDGKIYIQACSRTTSLDAAGTDIRFARNDPPTKEDLAPHVNAAFPEIHDWNTLRITLSRSGCYGRCPAYKIEIHGDGTVLYDGKNNVTHKGRRTAKISHASLVELVDFFRKANYFSLRDRYASGITDNPAYETSISFDGVSKSVLDYVGQSVGMPSTVSDVEAAIDRLSGASKCVGRKRAE